MSPINPPLARTCLNLWKIWTGCWQIGRLRRPAYVPSVKSCIVKPLTRSFGRLPWIVLSVDCCWCGWGINTRWRWLDTRPSTSHRSAMVCGSRCSLSREMTWLRRSMRSYARKGSSWSLGRAYCCATRTCWRRSWRKIGQFRWKSVNSS